MTTLIEGVLFDLDGTLLDTSPDLLYAMNAIRDSMGLSHLTSDSFNSMINLGSKAIVSTFGITEESKEFKGLREKFLALYEMNIAARTRFYPNMETVLTHLDEKKIPWGIVTNKLTNHTESLLKALQFEARPGCVVCGDTLSKSKPHPEPIWHACELLKIKPEACLYVGDAESDIAASRAAGVRSLIASYGYIDTKADLNAWGADAIIKDPIEIIKFL